MVIFFSTFFICLSKWQVSLDLGSTQLIQGFHGGSIGKESACNGRGSPAMWETQVWSLGWEDPLEKEMATHSSIPA